MNGMKLEGFRVETRRIDTVTRLGFVFYRELVTPGGEIVWKNKNGDRLDDRHALLMEQEFLTATVGSKEDESNISGHRRSDEQPILVDAQLTKQDTEVST